MLYKVMVTNYGVRMQTEKAARSIPLWERGDWHRSKAAAKQSEIRIYSQLTNDLTDELSQVLDELKRHRQTLEAIKSL